MRQTHSLDKAPVFLIPAYEPATTVIDTVWALIDSNQFHNGVIIDDGSGNIFSNIFQKLSQHPKITLLSYPRNLGKGAALKSGFEFIRSTFPQSAGIVTVDADGQHAVADILKVTQILSEHPQELVMGYRVFDSEVPFRSRAGNIITSKLIHLITGKRIKDTQTGLRGLPMKSIHWMLSVPLNGYDFEIEILLTCLAKQMALIEVEIETIYLNHNQSSHFNPTIDSFRIYAVISRFALRSLINILSFKKNRYRQNHYIRYDHTA